MSSFPTGALKIGTAILAVVALSACATSDRGASSSEQKKQAFPFVQFAPDGRLCDTAVPKIQVKVDRILQANGMTPLVPATDEILFFRANPNAVREFRERAAVAATSMSLSEPDSPRRVRLELMPQKDADCIAVKMWEECGPALAPLGEPSAWHYCGDPASRNFIKIREVLIEGLGLTSSGEID